MKLYTLGLAAMGLMLFGQIQYPSTEVGWVSNITGMGLCVFMVIRFGGAMEKMAERYGSALDRLSESITQLRIHCAAVQGEPEDE